jgi:hypothetical protein
LELLIKTGHWQTDLWKVSRIDLYFGIFRGERGG